MTEIVLVSLFSLFGFYVIITLFRQLLTTCISARWIALIAALYVICQYISSYYGVPKHYYPILLLVACFGLAFTFTATLKQRLIYPSVGVLLIIATEALAESMIELFHGNLCRDVAAAQLVAFAQIELLLARLLALVVVRVICRTQLMKDRNVSIKHWFIIMPIPVMSIVMCAGLAIDLVSYTTRSHLAPILILAGISGINMLAFIMYDELSAQSKTLVENERARNRLESDICRYNYIIDQSREFLALLHDSQKHREVVYDLLHSGENSTAMQYMKELLTNESTPYHDTVVINNPAVNAILRRKIAEATRYTINVICNYDAEVILPIDDVSLCLIFGNALDNAIEACRKLPESSERHIEINIRYKNDRLTIRISNTSEALRIENNSLVTTKRNSMIHGYGLRNVQKIVEENGGNSAIKFENGMFILSILFLL